MPDNIHTFVMDWGLGTGALNDYLSSKGYCAEADGDEACWTLPSYEWDCLAFFAACEGAASHLAAAQPPGESSVGTCRMMHHSVLGASTCRSRRDSPTSAHHCVRECMAWPLGCCRSANAAGVLIMRAGAPSRSWAGGRRARRTTAGDAWGTHTQEARRAPVQPPVPCNRSRAAFCTANHWRDYPSTLACLHQRAIVVLRRSMN